MATEEVDRNAVGDSQVAVDQLEPVPDVQQVEREFRVVVQRPGRRVDGERELPALDDEVGVSEFRVVTHVVEMAAGVDNYVDVVWVKSEPGQLRLDGPLR